MSKTMFYCPRCQTRLIASSHIGDMVHECASGNETLDNEDVVSFHTQVEEFNSTINPRLGPAEAMRAGIANKFMGTRAGLEGANVEEFTSRGKSTQVFRTRQFYKYIKL